VAQQMLFKHPATDHLSQSSVNTYQSDRVRASNGGGPPKCSIGHPNDFANYGLPAMCSDCDQRQYDSPCDRYSNSLRSIQVIRSKEVISREIMWGHN